MQGDISVWDGWCRYWGTFSRPWPVVIGFALAAVVSDVLFEAFKSLFWRLVQ